VNKFWNQSAGANRIVMGLTALGVIVVLLGGLILGTRLLGDDKSAAKDDTSNDLIVEPQLLTTTTTPVVTAPPVTAPNGMTKRQIEQPEGNMLDAYQLAFQFNQKNSGLSGPTYDQATRIATRFAEASATGKGADEFKEYFDQSAEEPWVNEYSLIYATVSSTTDETLLKARVWFTGKEKISGLPMRQAQHVFLLHRDTVTSLDIKPHFIGSGFFEDPDLGIHVGG
jgi:hypothetical protein